MLQLRNNFITVVQLIVQGCTLVLQLRNNFITVVQLIVQGCTLVLQLRNNFITVVQLIVQGCTLVLQVRNNFIANTSFLLKLSVRQTHLSACQRSNSGWARERGTGPASLGLFNR